MASEFDLIRVALAYTIGLLVTLLLERILTPRPNFINRPKSAWLLHFGCFTSFFALEFALYQRPFFTSAMVLAGWFFLVLVNNAKWAALKEPFVASDFEYFLDALKHPRLYIPFFGWWRIVLALLAVAVAMSLGVWGEPPVFTTERGTLWLCVGVLATLGAVSVLIGAATRTKASYEPTADLTRVGSVAFLFSYWWDEKKPVVMPENPALAAVIAPASDAILPHIVAVQSESFFDARRWLPAVSAHLYTHWDHAVAHAVQHGTLQVAAWGANTVRTEFAFLSGVANPDLGVHRFNPYRRMALAGGASLAAVLKKLGYYTVCIHPYAASFYGRERVMPALGFDEFIDIKEFSASDYAGPYVGDNAVAEKIAARLALATKPIFIFAITMENHGPLHLETVRPAERDTYIGAAGHDPVAGCDDLYIYLRHIASANQFVARVTEALANTTRPGVFAMYGDHVPSMGAVYRALGAPDGSTDYVIWRRDSPLGAQPATDMKVENLAEAVLRAAGLAP